MEILFQKNRINLTISFQSRTPYAHPLPWSRSHRWTFSSSLRVHARSLSNQLALDWRGRMLVARATRSDVHALRGPGAFPSVGGSSGRRLWNLRDLRFSCMRFSALRDSRKWLVAMSKKQLDCAIKIEWNNVNYRKTNQNNSKIFMVSKTNNDAGKIRSPIGSHLEIFLMRHLWLTEKQFCKLIKDECWAIIFFLSQ